MYAAATLSLAALERLVHAGEEGGGGALVYYRIEIPVGACVQTIDRRDLPADWHEVPAPSSTKAMGARWIREAGSAVLSAPSVLIETEHNILLNPLHRDFGRLRIAGPEPFRFDPRLQRP